MIKPLIKLLGILLLVLVAFMFGAYQYRTKSWPFYQGFFKGFAAYLTKDKAADKEQEIARWIENLKKGGYILYFRHANRDKWPEVEAFDLYEFASHTNDASVTSFKQAVCLSEQGIEEAKLIGKVFQMAKIPTGIVVSGPSCRTKQTAIYAFGKYDFVDNSIRFSRTAAEKRSQVSGDTLMKLLLNVEIRPGTNTIISGHSVNLDRGRGIDVDGDSPDLLETGFYVLERRSGNKLALVFSFKSISALAHNAINLKLN